MGVETHVCELQLIPIDMHRLKNECRDEHLCVRSEWSIPESERVESQGEIMRQVGDAVCFGADGARPRALRLVPEHASGVKPGATFRNQVVRQLACRNAGHPLAVARTTAAETNAPHPRFALAVL
eukprot:2492591-Rhodomonas_salina.1